VSQQQVAGRCLLLKRAVSSTWQQCTVPARHARIMNTGQKPSVSAAAEALFETKNVAEIRKVRNTA
jgi:hypothetical protein